MKQATKRAVATVAIAGLAVLGFASPAWATNPGTESGNNTERCAVSWSTSAVLDMDLSNDDPKYPGLMQDLSGQPVAYSNGGYIEAVEPGLKDPGYLEMNHFYQDGNATQSWRIPTASNHPIKDAKVTFKLADGYGDLSKYTVSFDPVSTNAKMVNWGGFYDDYTWKARGADAATQNADGTWTVALGDLPTMGATVYQFNVRNADGSVFPVNDQFVAEAKLTGSYFQGTGCALPPIDNPTPTPDIQKCQVEYLGTTIWTKTDSDITERIKIHDGGVSDTKGEVNADGWGAGSDAWGEGDTRTFRLYGGSHAELTNVRYEVKAVQGFSFDPQTVSALSTPGGGALQGNGLTEAVEGAGAIEFVDKKTITMSIDKMPADSSFSFSVGGVLDDTTDAMVLHHRLIGDNPNCEAATPEPTTTKPTPEPTTTTPTPEPTTTTPEPTTTTPEPTTATSEPTSSTQDAPASPTGPSSAATGQDHLAATGAGTSVLLVALGALLLALGIALRVRTRRS